MNYEQYHPCDKLDKELFDYYSILGRCLQICQHLEKNLKVVLLVKKTKELFFDKITKKKDVKEDDEIPFDFPDPTELEDFVDSMNTMTLGQSKDQLLNPIKDVLPNFDEISKQFKKANKNRIAIAHSVTIGIDFNDFNLDDEIRELKKLMQPIVSCDLIIGVILSGLNDEEINVPYLLEYEKRLLDWCFVNNQ